MYSVPSLKVIREPLTWLKSIKDPSGRLARRIVTLSEFNWDKPGKEHCGADELSMQKASVPRSPLETMK